MSRVLIALPFSILLSGCGWGFWVSDNKERNTPLEVAAQAGDLQTVQRLLAHGADPNEKSRVFGSPIHAAASRNQNAAVIRALLEAGADPNGRNAEANGCWVPPVYSAASLEDLENLRILLDAGATMSKTSHAPCSQLLLGRLRAPNIALLREHGFDIFAVDELGRNQLHLALAPPFVPKSEGVDYLIRSGVPLNARDRAGKTPLAYWRKPREFETHRVRAWLADSFSGDSGFKMQREEHARVSRLLEDAGARL